MSMNITNLRVITGSSYEIVPGGLSPGKPQYLDRKYIFRDVPASLSECVYVMTCGCDKLIDEKHPLVRFTVDVPVEVIVLYATKFPRLPIWLQCFKQLPGQVTRLDSDTSVTKGFFNLYSRSFSPGEIVLGGCSPGEILTDSFAASGGATYCMFSFALREQSNSEVRHGTPGKQTGADQPATRSDFKAQ